MSYTSTSSMRSNRYPLMGSSDGLSDCGCGCSGAGDCRGKALGSTSGNSAIGVLVIGGVVGLLWLTGRGAAPKRNRRRGGR